MEKAGITVLLKTRAVAATQDGIELNDGKMLLGATIVCTIGTSISPLVQHLDVPKERGRIRTAPDMRIEGQTNAWAVGDCAYIINAIDGKPATPTGQFAERQGRQAALNLVRLLKNEPTRPFSFKALGQLCSIGGYEAVAEMFGMRISGFLAWFLWRGVYLFKLPTWSRRIKVALDWSWDFLFPRDLSFLNTDATQHLTHAFYRAGDLMQRQGDLARVFTVIEEGEAEVVKTTEPSPGAKEEKVVAVLGKGDFFGEAELLGHTPSEVSIRARTVVRVGQVGSTLFGQIAADFPPFREMLTNAVTRRSGDIWRRLPLAKSLLAGESLATVLEAAPETFLRKDTTLDTAIKALGDSVTGHLLVLDEKQRLWGTLDRADLSQIIARIAVTPLEAQADFRQQKLGDLLLGDPVYITREDSLLVASATMLDHGITWLPVVQSSSDLGLVGVLRRERISALLIRKLEQREAGQAKAAS
jgi:NADH dehydrogenase